MEQSFVSVTLCKAAPPRSRSPSQVVCSATVHRFQSDASRLHPFSVLTARCSSNHRVMVQESGKRKRPNILVTGTPGTGKTTMSTSLEEATQLHHINVGELVKEKNLHDGWDNELDCYVLNEDLVCDELEDVMEEGGNIVDHHGCDFFPERWFDLVVVLQTDNTILYDRLSSRGYNDSKLSNNIECEIFQVLLEEAKESYPEDRVVAMKSDTIEDISRNVATLTEWVRNWPSPPQL